MHEKIENITVSYQTIVMKESVRLINITYVITGKLQTPTNLRLVLSSAKRSPRREYKKSTASAELPWFLLIKIGPILLVDPCSLQRSSFAQLGVSNQEHKGEDARTRMAEESRRVARCLHSPSPLSREHGQGIRSTQAFNENAHLAAEQKRTEIAAKPGRN